jgi:hypothetical protein
MPASASGTCPPPSLPRARSLSLGQPLVRAHAPVVRYTGVVVTKCSTNKNQQNSLKKKDSIGLNVLPINTHISLYPYLGRLKTNDGLGRREIEALPQCGRGRKVHARPKVHARCSSHVKRHCCRKKKKSFMLFLPFFDTVAVSEKGLVFRA